MLQSLHIKNLALIKEEEIIFEDGLNILTGETGAGKSVVIGSVNLALGAKADQDMIRAGEEYALAELTFTLDERQEKLIRELDITPEDGTLLISRKISQGRSVCRVNGETSTVGRLRDIADILINIHGQNDHQALLRPSKQKEILDRYAGEKLDRAKEKMSGLYAESLEIEKELAELGGDASERNRELDLLRYEIDEISNAGIKPGEEEELDRLFRKMSASKRIIEAAEGAAAVLSGDGGTSFSDALTHARRELSQVAAADGTIEGIVSQIDDMDSLLQELVRSLHSAAADAEYDESDLYRTEERLDFLRRLEDKYSADEAGILELLEKKEERRDVLENAEAVKEELAGRRDRNLKEMRSACTEISSIRRKAADELADKIRASLVDCNFLDVRFEIAVEKDEAAISSDGWDSVRFDIQTNPGEAVRPLSAIASGGELSRIMLGIKTVLADKNDTPTLIFDEIDAGISGRTAWKVSEKLGQLSHEHQIICITHLPQIAAMADHHFLIEKNVEDDRTLTSITPLDEKQSVGELARLLAGDEVTEEVMKNAEQLKEKADREKAV